MKEVSKINAIIKHLEDIKSDIDSLKISHEDMSYTNCSIDYFYYGIRSKRRILSLIRNLKKLLIIAEERNL